MASNPQALEEWKLWLQEWQASGLSQAAWCREKGVAHYRFSYWKKRLLANGPVSQNFVELTDSNCSKIALEKKGCRICLEPNFNETTLFRLLKLLEKC